MTAAYTEIVERIQQLTPDERIAITKMLDDMLEREWNAARREMAAEAKRENITDETIDRAIAKRRYGK